MLEEFEQKDLFVINDDTKFRISEIGQRESNLDLMFASGGILNNISYKQSKDLWGSDHFPIEFEIKAIYKTYKKKTDRISTKKSDWKMYKKIIEKELIFGEDRYIKATRRREI